MGGAAGTREEGVTDSRSCPPGSSLVGLSQLSHIRSTNNPLSCNSTPFLFLFFFFSFLLSAFPVRGGTGTAADHKPLAAAACIGMVRGVGLAVNEPIRGCQGLSGAVRSQVGRNSAR